MYCIQWQSDKSDIVKNATWSWYICSQGDNYAKNDNSKSPAVVALMSAAD